MCQHMRDDGAHVQRLEGGEGSHQVHQVNHWRCEGAVSHFGDHEGTLAWPYGVQVALYAALLQSLLDLDGARLECVSALAVLDGGGGLLGGLLGSLGLLGHLNTLLGVLDDFLGRQVFLHQVLGESGKFEGRRSC